VSGQGKLEQLIVASQGIAASTAQLVVASRVKADRNSKNMSALSQASKGVTQATGGVVATAKACGQMIEENGNDHALLQNVYACVCVCVHTCVCL
jgi:huntingtin interacting protein 1